MRGFRCTCTDMEKYEREMARVFTGKEKYWLEYLQQVGAKSASAEEEQTRFTQDLQGLLKRLSVKEMKARLDTANVDHSRCAYRAEFRELLRSHMEAAYARSRERTRKAVEEDLIALDQDPLGFQRPRLGADGLRPAADVRRILAAVPPEHLRRPSPG